MSLKHVIILIMHIRDTGCHTIDHILVNLADEACLR
jgi:hypothetical protein